MNEPLHIAIVTPVFNDWPSCARLVAELDALGASLGEVSLDVFIVDDGSSEGVDTDLIAALSRSSIGRVNVTELACNLGHQRAIAVGLYQVVDADCYDHVVVMDSDGEDQPTDVLRLIEAQRQASGAITVAVRSKRSEGWFFRVFYTLYKFMYRILTGSTINFGNFSIVSVKAAERLLHMPELWNNFGSAVLRSRLKYREIDTERGSRFFGSSKMNFTNLVIHGLNAISVSSEVVFIRVMLISFAIILLSLMGAAAVLALRFLTELAIPGWASDVIGTIAIILTQTMFFFFISVFLLLHSRSNPSVAPFVVIPGYIAKSYDLAVDDKS